MDSRTNMLVEEFNSQVDLYHGLYLDATRGFNSLWKESKEFLEGLPPEERDAELECKHFYRDGSGFAVTHRCTMSELRDRNHSSGVNWKHLANAVLVTIFNLWEDNYRQQIAASMSLQTKDLKSDIMGDIRILRNSIIHHRALCTKTKDKFKILKWFEKGDEVRIDPEQFLEIKKQIRLFLKSLCSPS